MNEQPMKVSVHTRTHGTLEFDNVSYCRYEAKYTNRKPTVLALYRTESWSTTETVAEFHAADIIGWSKVEDPVDGSG